jgi:hypothetical protein
MKGKTMNCPSEIADVVTEILQRGLVRIRGYAGAQQLRRCFIEADHLHNLPHVLSDYRVERLQYYWDVERASFVTQVPETERRDLEPLWEQMAVLMDSHGIPHGQGKRGI